MLIFHVTVRLSELELREFVHSLLHQGPTGVFWLIPTDRARLHGKYRVIEVTERKGEVVALVAVERLEGLEWRSRSGLSKFTWSRERGGLLQGELSSRALAKLVSIVGLKRVQAQLLRSEGQERR